MGKDKPQKFAGGDGRERFRWTVRLQSEDGQTIDYPIESYWSPDFEGTAESIMVAAAIEASQKTGKSYKPLSVQQAKGTSGGSVSTLAGRSA